MLIDAAKHKNEAVRRTSRSRSVAQDSLIGLSTLKKRTILVTIEKGNGTRQYTVLPPFSNGVKEATAFLEQRCRTESFACLM